MRPLAPKTMARIARGLKKFVLENPEPFIIQCNHGGKRRPNNIKEPMPTITGKHGYGIVEPTLAPYMGTNTTNHPGGSCKDPIHTITTGNQQCVISPLLIQYHSETVQGEVRGQTIDDPVMTVDSSNRYGLVTSFLSKFYKSGTGQDLREPLHTITTSPGHFGEVRAFLMKYYGTGTGQSAKEPLDTITAQDRFGLVVIDGTEYQIVDIGLRMLEPSELYGCQGFPEDYIIDHDYTGKRYPNTPQLAMIGDNLHQGEVVAPENKLREMAIEAVRAAGGSGVTREDLETIMNRAVMRIIAALSQMGFYLDGKKLAEAENAVKAEIDRRFNTVDIK